MKILISLFFIFSFFGSACSSTPKTEHAISQLMVTQVKIRRPLSPGADPETGPGGMDYQSDPLPDAQYDCQETEVLFSEVNLSALRQCLQSLNSQKTSEGLQFEYRLQRKFDPEWLLLEEESQEKPPSCLKVTLPKILIPREIFFQSREKEYSCFNSRIDIEASQTLGITLPQSKQSLMIEFPMQKTPKDDAETLRMLKAWSLTAFFSEESPRTILSKPVPDSICKKCFGKKSLYQEDPSEPPMLYWPTKEAL